MGSLGLLLTAACSGAVEGGSLPEGASGPSLETQGDKRLALGAVQGTRQLFGALAQARVENVAGIADQVLRLAFTGSAVASPDGPAAERRQKAPLPNAADVGSASCDAAGCHFDHFGISSYVLSGDVLLDSDGDMRVLTIDLVDDAASTHIAGSLLASQTSLDGWLSAVTTSSEGSEEVDALGFVRLRLDAEAAFVAAAPISGSVYAEWTATSYSGRKATIPFP